MDDPAVKLDRRDALFADIVRPDLSVRIEHGLGIAKLRLFRIAADARFRAIVGFDPPPACRQLEQDSLTYAWLAPGEWLVTGAEADILAWVARTAASADDVLAIDLSHGRTAFWVEGAGARAALAAYSPLDVEPGAFPVGAVARSLFGEAGMFIARLHDEAGLPRFRVIVDQTMAGYAARLIARL